MKRGLDTALGKMIAAIFAVICLFCTQAQAEPPAIYLSSTDTYYQPLVRHLLHAQDDSLGIGLSDVTSGSLEFAPIGTPFADFKRGPERHWLWAKLRNETGADGTWRIDVRRQFLQELTLYAVRGGLRSEILIQHTDQKVFSDRIINSRFLQADIDIAQGETIDIYFAYRSTATTYLPPAVGTVGGVAASHLQEFTIDALFNGGLAAMFVLTLLFMPIVGWPLSLSFCAYIAAGALFVHQADGYTFQYLWPNAPQLNDAANLGFMLLMPVFGLSFARALFGTRKSYPIWDKVLFGYIAVAAVLAVFSQAYVQVPAMMTLAYAFVPVGTLVQLFTGLSMVYRRMIGAVPYLLGAIGVFISFAYATIAHIQPGYWNLDRTLDVGHASILFECFAFASAIVLRMVAIRTERDTALRAELVESQRRLNTEKALRKSQADFANANKLSEDRLNQLASVSHDLQAPLTTLRRVVGQIGHDNEATTGRMYSALDYLERLAQQELRKGALHPNSENMTATESFPVSVVLNNVAELFEDHAAAEGISFRQRIRVSTVTADPVRLMRIVSNLVGNAIEHAQARKILVANRMRSGKAIIQVWDNGVGIAPLDQSKVLGRGDKGKMSAGSGLGLSIVAEECATEGIAFDICSKENRGTCITLTLPTIADGSKGRNL